MNRKGFTLVELAIVLVIIGLLVGGVLQGQELIKQAQIRNVISRVNQYDTAINTFKAKYDQLPGDFSRASSFLVNSPDGGTNKNNSITIAGNQGDGDGNGTLVDGAITPSYDVYSGEIANLWVHLSNVGLIKGSFVQPSVAFAAATAPTCKADGTGCNNTIALSGYPDLPVGTGVIVVSEGTRSYYIMGVGSSLAANLQAAVGNNFTPEEAFSLDSKLDNGTAHTGSVQAVTAYSNAGAFTVDATGGAALCHTAGTYNFSLTTKLCTLRIRVSS